MRFFRQYFSSINRIYIEKRRNPAVTCCEYFSHLIMFIFLLGGYSLSKLEKFDAKNYAIINASIPPAGVSGNLNESSALFTTITQFLDGPLPAPTLDQYLLLNRLLSSGLVPSRNLITSTSFGGKFANLLYKGSLHFAPAGVEVDDLISYMQSTYTSFQTLDVYTHPSESEAVDYILTNVDNPAFALIVLRDVTPQKVNYVIRQNYTVLPNTNELINYVAVGLDTTYQEYLLSGYLTIQKAVDEWAFQYTGSTDSLREECSSPPSPLFIPFPTPKYEVNPFYDSVGFLLGLAIAMASLYPVSRTVKTIVEEKELKIKELMRIMGLQSFAYQMSWFLVSFLLFFWIAVSETVLSSGSFLSKSNPAIVFALFFLFSLSMITFSFLISVFFSNSKLASIVAPVLLFAAILPRFIFFTTATDEAYRQKYAASLLSPTALTFAADLIASYEKAGTGVQFSNINEGRYSFGSALQMMFVDFILYGILAWYFDLVLPQEYGTPEHPFFFLNYKYYLRAWNDFKSMFVTRDQDAARARVLSYLESDAFLAHVPELNENVSSDAIESIPSDLRGDVRVVISSMRKKYPDGKVAVKSLSCALVQGQITCLLGSNGAGKTTTISILTGLIQATSGKLAIYGYDIASDIHEIRQMTGICPQQNVLFPFLTVREHLNHFGSIKGLYGEALRQSVRKCIDDVGLTEKENSFSKSLSGGMKRKLCLAIALIGDPKLVLLDEPTSGMDPYSRRATWDILQKCKAGRVVILTTHFMDEADTLADRILIMSDGRLRCSGSSLFLKTRFGAGYILTISIHSKEDKNESKEPMNDIDTVPVLQVSDTAISHLTHLKVSEAAIQLVQDAIPSATVRSSNAGEIIFQLPLESLSQFAILFRRLKTDGPSVGITSYGVSITSLEQVFIRLAEETNFQRNDDRPALKTPSDPIDATTVIPMEIVDSNGLINPPSNIESMQKNHPSLDDEYEEDERSHIDIALSKVYSMIRSVLTLSYSYLGAFFYYIGNWCFKSTRGSPSPTIVPQEELGDVELANIPSESIPNGLDATPTVPAAEVVNRDGSCSKSSQSLLMSWCSFIFESMIYIQLTQLLLKRVITARRDKKGLFFQVVFPAVQILAILALLTIRYNPAGHTVKLHLQTYHDKTPTAIIPLLTFQWNNVHPDLSQIISNYSSADYFEMEGTDITNSSALSDWFLETYSSSPESRYGGYIFDDVLTLNVTIDWPYVKRNVPFILDLLSISGFFNQSISLPDVNLPPFTIEIINNTLYANISDVLTTIDIGGLDVAGIDNIIGNSSSLEFLTVSYDSATGTLTFSDLSLSSTSNSIALPGGTVTFSVSDFIALLPNTTDNMVISLPSPYTVMHNSSSPHAIAFYGGQLIESTFRTCSPAVTALTEILDPLFTTNQQTHEKDFPADSYSNLRKGKTDLDVDTTSNNEEEPQSLYAFESISNAPRYLIKNHPLPLTKRQNLEIRVILALFASLFLLVPLCYIPSVFCAFIVQERYSKCKHLQVVSGVSPHLYWIATYIWDIFLYCILACFILLCFFAYGRSSAVIFIGSQESLAVTTLLLLTYGVSGIAISYIYSLLFDNYSTAQISIMAINFGTGFVFVLAYFVMVNIPETAAFGKAIVNFFRFFPSYNIGEGLINLSATYFENNVLGGNISYYAWDVTGRNIIFMLVEAVGYFSFILLLEASWFRRILHRIEKYRYNLVPKPESVSDEDEDVSKEAAAVQQSSQDFILKIQDVTKSFLSGICNVNVKHALRGISIGIKRGERFGLLGINGAGKTTTLSILTGDFQPSDGIVSIDGMDISDPQTMKLIGYCPQVDPILDLMTGREILYFFGRIRGIPVNTLAGQVSLLLKQVGLQPFADRVCGRYSGGNKRKLSLAIALIGDPKVLLLDEPSTGMDPESRRKMWNVIQAVSESRSVILVSHSMEECEALCTRIGILVSGRVKCIGTSTHLKAKFGAGYQIEVRCREIHEFQVNAITSANIDVKSEIPVVEAATVIDGGDHRETSQATMPLQLQTCLQLLANILPQYDILETHGYYFRIRTQPQDQKELDLVSIFECLESNKKALGIIDYSVTQASLEQIFIRIARTQSENQDPHSPISTSI